jgi:hypothetical protein
LRAPEILPVVPAHNTPSEATSRQIKSGSRNVTPDSMKYGLYGRVVFSRDTAVKRWRIVLVAIELLMLRDFEESSC